MGIDILATLSVLPALPQSPLVNPCALISLNLNVAILSVSHALTILINIWKKAFEDAVYLF